MSAGAASNRVIITFRTIGLAFGALPAVLMMAARPLDEPPTGLILLACLAGAGFAMRPFEAITFGVMLGLQGMTVVLATTASCGLSALSLLGSWLAFAAVVSATAHHSWPDAMSTEFADPSTARLDWAAERRRRALPVAAMIAAGLIGMLLSFVEAIPFLIV